MISLPRKMPHRRVAELERRHAKTQRLTPVLIVSEAHCVPVSFALNSRVEHTSMKEKVAFVFRSLGLICRVAGDKNRGWQ